MIISQLARIVVALGLGCGIAFAGNVRIAERPLVGPFPTLQAAVNAALDGESLLVTPGVYAPFTIDGKGVSVFVAGSGPVTITGKVAVKNLVPAQSVVLSRLVVTGNFAAALEITNVTGHVRVQDSTFNGFPGSNGPSTAGTAASIVSSLNIVFSNCTIEGGYGGLQSGEQPVEGGIGLDSLNSSIALYDCTVEGGSGSVESAPRGGNGGTAYVAFSYGMFAAGCTFEGGYGGGGDWAGCNPGGVGGDALQVNASQAHLLANTYVAGGGGWSSCGPFSPAGQTIVSLNGGIIDQLTGARRKISAAPVAADDVSVPITVTGEPGDIVFLLFARKPGFAFKKPLNGCWMVPIPFLSTTLATGTIGAGGSLVIPRTFDIANGTSVARLNWMQAMCIDTAGKPFLTGPAHVLSLDAASAPDCNANGRQDALDVIFGGVGDCDGNLTPDACETDCNSNGVLDSCDIATHTSSDVNGNGVPDECEAQFLTWYVDDSAPPGGNGSQSAPFQTLQAAVTVAFHGDTIVLADGLYQGASNRGINLNGRSLTLRSANGPGVCTIDCQGAARALSMNLNEHVTIEGITFANGGQVSRGGAIEATNAQLVLRNCVFTHCDARLSGGAISSSFGSTRLENCVFTGNTSLNPGQTFEGKGGAVNADRTVVSARDCLFANNQGLQGGACIFSSTQSPVPGATLTHCQFLENRALRGGALFAARTTSGTTHTIDDCLFAGNTATNYDGGAVYTQGSSNVSSSSFISNSALTVGGAIAFADGSSGTLRNSICWGDSAGQGPEISLGGFISTVVPLDASYNDVQGGQAGIAVIHGVLTWGAGNLDLDPQFTDSDGPDNNPLTYADNDYSLSASSPCIDAGDNAALIPDLLDIDGDGNTLEPMPLDVRHATRRRDVISVPDTGSGTAPIVDMGAIERQG